MPSEVKLLGCPFCGGEAAMVQQTDTVNPNCTWIECTKCSVMTDSVYDADKEIAAATAALIWNTRTPPAAPADDAVEALENAIWPLAKYSPAERKQATTTIWQRIMDQRWHLRRETMTEAELEREAKKAAVVLDYPALNVHRGEWLHILDAINLAKKFSGM